MKIKKKLIFPNLIKCISAQKSILLDQQKMTSVSFKELNKYFNLQNLPSIRQTFDNDSTFLQIQLPC